MNRNFQSRGPDRLLVPIRRACHEELFALDLVRGCGVGCLHCRHESDGGVVTATISDPGPQLQEEIAQLRIRGHLPAFVVLGEWAEPFPPLGQVQTAVLRALETLLENRVGVSVITRCRIPEEILELFAGYRPLVRVRVAFFSGRSQELAQWEPGGADLEGRMATLQALARRRIPTAVHLGPLLPTVNDDPDVFREVFAAASDVGLGRATTEIARVTTGVRDRLEASLAARAVVILAAYRDQVDPETIRRLPAQDVRLRLYRRFEVAAQRYGLRLGYCRCVDRELGRPPCNLGFGSTKRRTRQLGLFPGTAQATKRKSRPSAQPHEVARSLKPRRTRSAE